MIELLQHKLTNEASGWYAFHLAITENSHACARIIWYNLFNNQDITSGDNGGNTTAENYKNLRKLLLYQEDNIGRTACDLAYIHITQRSSITQDLIKEFIEQDPKN